MLVDKLMASLVWASCTVSGAVAGTMAVNKMVFYANEWVLAIRSAGALGGGF